MIFRLERLLELNAPVQTFPIDFCKATEIASGVFQFTSNHA
jgi:hypothetical protein